VKGVKPRGGVSGRGRAGNSGEIATGFEQRRKMLNCSTFVRHGLTVVVADEDAQRLLVGLFRTSRFP